MLVTAQGPARAHDHRHHHSLLLVAKAWETSRTMLSSRFCGGISPQACARQKRVPATAARVTVAVAVTVAVTVHCNPPSKVRRPKPEAYTRATSVTRSATTPRSARAGEREPEPLSLRSAVRLRARRHVPSMAHGARVERVRVRTATPSPHRHHVLPGLDELLRRLTSDSANPASRKQALVIEIPLGDEHDEAQ